MLLRVLIILLFIFSFSFAGENPELQKLLAIIQGSFNDKVYTITIQKAKEYLQKAPKDDKYREKVLEILAYSYIKSGNLEGLKTLLPNLETENISKDTKINIYKLAYSSFKNPDDKVDVLLKLYNETKDSKYLISAADILFENKKWEEITHLPYDKEINHIKAFAYYKLGKYQAFLDYTQDLSKFKNDKKILDNIYYYRGLSYLKLNKKDLAIKEFEKIENKTPDILKFLADYYIKSKKFEKAEEYLKPLIKYDKAFASFYLGLIYENKKEYQKAYKYYKNLLKEENDYSKLATVKILKLKAKKLVPKEDFYSIRIVLYKKQETAKKFIEKHNLNQCFIYPYKHFYGVYCGLYLDKEQAKEHLKEFRKKTKVKDILVDKINI